MKYSLKDVFIVPAEVSYVSSRSECNPYDANGMLPLFTAPMSSVVDLNNYNKFKENKIMPIIPRSVDFYERVNLITDNWCAYSLDEFIDLITLFREHNRLNTTAYVLIDIANGHMYKLHETIMEAKKLFGSKIKIMAGNIANPLTYKALSEAGADYVRLSVGTGSACITASNTSIYYPMASLIKDCYEISKQIKNPAYIVADGGMKNYSDIIKALALGADYVMVGSLFNKMLESAGETYYTDTNNKVDQHSEEIILQFRNGCPMLKHFYGMSTKRAQKELGSDKIKTSEGIEKTINVEYTMAQWTENFIDYLKSAMSYTSKVNINQFVGDVETIIVSTNASEAINK